MTIILSILCIGLFFWLLALQDSISTLKFRLRKLEEKASFPTPAPVQQTAQQPLATPTAVAPQSVPQTTGNTPKETVNWVKVFAWLGGFTLLLGIVFWIKYALENNLISPATRITCSLVFASLLYYIGVRITQARYKTTADTLAASGLSIAYVAVFSAYNFYQLLPMSWAFFLLGITALAAFATAVWKRAPYVGILAQLIGFLTPFLFSSANPQWFFFLFFITCIACASVAAGLWCHWPKQLISCGIFTGICLLFCAVAMPVVQLSLLFTFVFIISALYFTAAWTVKRANLCLIAAVAVAAVELVVWCHGSSAQAGAYMGWCCGLAALFTVAAFILYKQVEDEFFVWCSGTLVSVISGICLYQAAAEICPEWKAFILLAFAVVYGLCAAWIYQTPQTGAAKDARVVWQCGISIFFTTYTLASVCSNEWLTLALAAEGTALIWLNSILRLPKLNAFGSWLLGSAAVRLLINPMVLQYHAHGAKIFNWILYTYGLAGVLFFTAAHLWQPKEDTTTPVWLNGLGVLLWFVLVNLEIAHYFSAGPYIDINLTAPMAAAATYTIVWALSGAACLFLAAPRTQPWLKKAGFVLLGGALFKLFLSDIWALPTGARIIVLLSVAAILITISFVYQRYKPTSEK